MFNLGPAEMIMLCGVGVLLESLHHLPIARAGWHALSAAKGVVGTACHSRQALCDHVQRHALRCALGVPPQPGAALLATGKCAREDQIVGDSILRGGLISSAGAEVGRA